jgi:DNA-binding MarR family transcriptional regulator
MVLRQESWKQCVPEGLSPTQAKVLRRLEVGRSRTVGALASELRLSAATLSEAVGSLVEKGLVKRGMFAGDRRKVALFLTREGRRVAERLGDPEELFERAACRLSPFEQALLARSLARLVEELQEVGVISVARICTTCRHFRCNQHPGQEAPHHCAFIDRPLAAADLRLDCPDHAFEEDPSLRVARRVAWVVSS